MRTDRESEMTKLIVAFTKLCESAQLVIVALHVYFTVIDILHFGQKLHVDRWEDNINPLKTKRRLLYLKTQIVPRSKHFSSRL